MSTLHKNVAKAAAVREMCKTKGFEIVRNELDAEIKRISEKMLDASTKEQDALELRKQAQVWVALQKLLKKIMLTGEFSAKALENLEDLPPSTDVKVE